MQHKGATKCENFFGGCARSMFDRIKIDKRLERKDFLLVGQKKACQYRPVMPKPPAMEPRPNGCGLNKSFAFLFPRPAISTPSARSAGILEPLETEFISLLEVS